MRLQQDQSSNVHACSLWMLLFLCIPFYIQFIHRGRFWKDAFAWQHDGKDLYS